MQAYSAYYKNGQIIPIGNPVIQEGRKLAIIVLDEPLENNTKTLTEAQEALQRLEKYRGTLKRDVDIKKERLEYLDEKYGNLS